MSSEIEVSVERRSKAPQYARLSTKRIRNAPISLDEFLEFPIADRSSVPVHVIINQACRVATAMPKQDSINAPIARAS